MHFKDLMSDHLAKASAWYTVSALANRGLNFLAMAVIARYIGQEQFGQLGMVLSTIGMAVGYASLGLGAAVSKYLAELRESSPERSSGILALSAGIATAAGTVAATLLFTLRHYIASRLFGHPDLTDCIAIGAGILFFGVVNLMQVGAVAGLEGFRPMAITNVLTGLISLPLILCATQFAALHGALWALLVSSALNCACFWCVIWWLCRRHGLPRPTALSLIAERHIIARFSLPALLTSALIGSITWFCGVLVVRIGGGFSQFGLYVAADRWRQLLLFPSSCITSAALPLISSAYGRGNVSAFNKLIKDMLVLATLSTVIPSVVVSAASSLGMEMFGKDFKSGAIVLVLAALAAIPTMFNTILGLPMIAVGKMWLRLGYDAVLGILLLGATVIFVPRLQAAGAALAQLLAYATICLILSVSLRHFVRATTSNRTLKKA